MNLVHGRPIAEQDRGSPSLAPSKPRCVCPNDLVGPNDLVAPNEFDHVDPTDALESRLWTMLSANEDADSSRPRWNDLPNQGHG